MKTPAFVFATAIAILLLGQDNACAQAGGSILAGQAGFDQKLGMQVPLDLRFRNDQARDIALQEYFGQRPVILALVYYRCPLLCNQVLNSLTRTLKVLTARAGSEFELVAVSIDPAETPELAGRKKAAYLERYDRAGTEDGWHFLVGERRPIDDLCKTVGFRYQYNPQTNLYAHAAGIVILTPGGRVSRYFYGIEYPPEEVERELRQASAGRIGSPISRLLLLCYDYDAATGKYTLAIVRIMRVLGALTAVSLGTYLLLMFRREHKERVSDLATRWSPTDSSPAGPGVSS